MLGATRSHSGSSANYWQFTGEQSDRVLNPNDSLYYLRARYYDTATGRFMSQDTLRGEQTQPQTWNRYAYALNNPTSRIDPTGMDSELITGECLSFTLAVEAFLITSAITLAFGPWAGLGASLVIGSVIASAQEARSDNDAANTSFARSFLAGLLGVLNQAFGGAHQGAYETPPVGLGKGPGGLAKILSALYLGQSGVSCAASV